MELSELRNRLGEAEKSLGSSPLVECCGFETPHGEVSVWVTDRFRKACRKSRAWKTVPMLTALKNATYGFDPRRPRSRGGSDGVFLLERGFQPPNEMMRKIFDRFLDRPSPLLDEILDGSGVSIKDLPPVRVVSHHMRLLGVLVRGDTRSDLVLVDCDNTKDS